MIAIPIGFDETMRPGPEMMVNFNIAVSLSSQRPSTMLANGVVRSCTAPGPASNTSSASIAVKSDPAVAVLPARLRDVHPETENLTRGAEVTREFGSDCVPCPARRARRPKYHCLK